MRDETKVGFFVLTGIALFGTAIFMLGDYSIYSRYSLFVEFSDVAGLPDKSLVKLSGVEIGKVREISIRDDRVVVEVAVKSDVKIFRDARFTVGSTSIIGSKFLQIDQGRASAGVIEPGAVIKGEDTLSLDKSLARTMASIQEILDDVGGKGKLSRNLNETIANLRDMTANMSELIGDTRPHVSRAMTRMDSISEKLDSLLAKTEELVARINSGQGAVGALMSDPKVKDDVTSTLSNFKDASASAKDVLGRVNSFRVFWLYESRYEPLARGSRGDIGIRIYPRDGRYYYLGASNIGNPSDISRGTDYERKNRVDARLGWETGGMDLYAGLIRGAGGFGIKYRPFHGKAAWDRLAVTAEASDFLRNRFISDRRFNTVEYGIGAEIKVHRLITVGARLNDLQETKRTQYTARVAFEDKDIAYLFGLISFSSAGMKGRSSSK
ncbi:MAG: MlaD family protein [bacterium]